MVIDILLICIFLAAVLVAAKKGIVRTVLDYSMLQDNRIFGTCFGNRAV